MDDRRPADVDLWLTFHDEIDDPVLLADLRQLMTHEERLQEDRFRFADDRKRFRITRALVRTTLSSYAAVAPEDWVFVTNHHGCPRVAPLHREAAGISFNLSHTRGLIALAVTRHAAIGVDVEHVTTRTVSLGIARRFFAANEVGDLAAVAPAAQQHRFFEYWTMKESYIKARGMGLSLPLDKFSFRFPDDHSVRLEMAEELGDDPARWNFFQYRPTSNHLLALCIGQSSQVRRSPPNVSIRRTVPTRMHEAFDLPLLRR